MIDPNWNLDNDTCAKYTAHLLWKQGIRSSDRTIIELQYGYTAHETDRICEALKEFETIANGKIKDYNPDIGF